MNRIDTPDDEIVRLYTEERLGSVRIGRKLGLNPQTVVNRLKENGIARRPIMRKKWEFYDDLLLAMLVDVDLLTGRELTCNFPDRTHTSVLNRKASLRRRGLIR